MRTERHCVILVITCFIIFAPAQSASAQSPSAQMLSPNPYQHIDDLARNPRDYATIQALYEQITATTLFGPYPESISSRLYRNEMNHGGTTSSPITEKSIADAANYLGRYLGGSSYTGTNELQVRLLRVAMYRDLPHLLKSPTPPENKDVVGPDMTPAGGAYIALLLLRQKLTNPNWFGDPDAQNQLMLHPPNPQTQAKPFSSLRVSQEPALSVAVRQKLARGLKSDNNAMTAAFHRFLDMAGFDK
jgi:hypothetical protein